MAHFIYKNLKENSTFIHFNGSFHSDYCEGIYWYLKKINPKLKIVTITTIEQKDNTKISEETAKKADFIIVTDELITKTY